MSIRTLVVLAASALAIGNASAAASWHQPEFADAKSTVEKTRAQVRNETIAFLAKGGKQLVVGDTLAPVERVTDRSRTEVLAERTAVQTLRSHENAERSMF
jgi:hypothetical protein